MEGEKVTHFSILYPDRGMVAILGPDTESAEVEEHLRGELISLRVNELADQAPHANDPGDCCERVISETVNLDWSDTVLTIGSDQVPGFSTSFSGHVVAFAQAKSCWVAIIARPEESLPQLRELSEAERETLASRIGIDEQQ
ncbi:hypothetical protein GCM10022198_08270 [Klugiella xanthotipulae]|nr:hypothetical protein [Klugiella xanthotipulae]